MWLSNVFAFYKNILQQVFTKYYLNKTLTLPWFTTLFKKKIIASLHTKFRKFPNSIN